MHHAIRWAQGLIVVLILSASVSSALAGPLPVSAPVQPPVVVRADVDPVERDRLVIRGMNFGVESAPIVLLADVPLEVVSFNDAQIVVRLPLDAPAARYRLRVLAHGMLSSQFFELTLDGRRS
jgi:hypothetical protein